MSSKKYLIAAAGLFFIAASIINAQTLGGSFILGAPQGEFKDNVNRLGYGFQLQGTLGSPSITSPFTIGLSASYLIYGEESEKRPFSYTNPDISVDANRTNSLANLHVLFLVSPFEGSVRPYAEAIFGGGYISTRTNIKSEYSQEEIASTTNFEDFTWSYGAGGGLLIRLIDNLGEIGGSLYLDLKARYQYGTEAEYLTEDGVVINRTNGTVSYLYKKSKTDLISFHIGVMAFLL